MYRKSTPADCKRIYDLICEMEQKTLSFEQFVRIYQKQSDSPSYYCLVCEQGKQVIGVLNLRLEDQLHHCQPIAEIMEFAVDAAFRGQGIGKEMIANACQIVKDMGCTQIEAACNQLRSDTHRFYLREGFHNFHYKFSKSLSENDTTENVLGR